MKEAPHNKGLQSVEEWFNRLHWEILDFQKQAWLSYLNGDSGIVNAPTGSGKTYSILLGIFLTLTMRHPEFFSRIDLRIMKQ